MLYIDEYVGGPSVKEGDVGSVIIFETEGDGDVCECA